MPSDVSELLTKADDVAEEVSKEETKSEVSSENADVDERSSELDCASLAEDELAVVETVLVDSELDVVVCKLDDTKFA